MLESACPKSRVKAPARPAVVLCTQENKAQQIDTYPFNLAYEVFTDGLAHASRWLVIGYSFRDEPVNTALQREFTQRDPKPRVLVVTRGQQPLREEIQQAFGWSSEQGTSDSWLTVYLGGASGLQDSDAWADFVAAEEDGE